MRLGTRLLLALLPTVAAVMTAYAIWALRQRVDTVVREAQRETGAYATALGIALEYAFRDPDLSAVQEIIDRLSEQPKVYGVLVYDTAGAPLFVSSPLPAVALPPASKIRETLRSGATTALERTINDVLVYSQLRPIRSESGAVLAVFEVAQPLEFVQAEERAIRGRFVLNTLTLLIVLAVLTLWLIHRTVSRPMHRFVEGVRRLGRGDLAHRMEEAGGGELAALALELNRMAGGLEAARDAALLRAEESITLERRLRESEKLAAVGKLAAGLAHQIAAPLNVVSGRAEMALKHAGLPPDQERQLRIIVQQIAKIRDIVRELLEYTRRRQPERRVVDLAEVVDGVVELLEEEFARWEVEIVRSEPRPLWVHADADQLHQVFVNLFLNAVQAMEGSPSRRRLEVRVRAGADAEACETGVVAIEVADTGPGFTPEVAERIFEPFVTSKQGGTGLGLVVARSIAEEHGGTLTASAAESAGAVLRLTLPCGDPTGEADA